jgi:hypothetical protein
MLALWLTRHPPLGRWRALCHLGGRVSTGRLACQKAVQCAAAANYGQGSQR